MDGRRLVDSFVVGEPGFEMSEGFGHVAAAVAEANMSGLVVDGAGEEKDTRFADEAFAESLRVLGRFEAGKTDRGGVGRSPFKEIGVTREESGELGKIVQNNLEVAIDELLAVAESDSSKEFAGGAGADGGVVLEGDDFLKDGGVAAGKPAKTKAREAISLANGRKAEGTFVEIASGGKTSGGIVLEFAVDLVGENVDTLTGCEFQDTVENFRRHEQPGGIVWGINVDGAGARANERFEGGEIVGPSVCRTTGPFGNRGAGAFGNGESAFVAGRFNNGVILRSEQGVIEDEDGFFGGRKNNELIGMNLGIHGGENFAKPGSTGRFGVAAPVTEKGIVSAGFEGENFLDGLGLGVRG